MTPTHADAKNEYSEYHFRTLKEAQRTAQELSMFFPDPAMAYFGLHELMLNAVEHGNLGIGFDEKSELLKRGTLQEEIERRLALPEFATRTATATITITQHLVEVTITDQGAGFNWRPYLSAREHAPGHSITLPHGRGIISTLALSFKDLRYCERGNSVTCGVRM